MGVSYTLLGEDALAGIKLLENVRLGVPDILRVDELGVGAATELVRGSVHMGLVLELAGVDGGNVGLGDVEFHLTLVHHYPLVKLQQ